MTDTNAHKDINAQTDRHIRTEFNAQTVRQIDTEQTENRHNGLIYICTKTDIQTHEDRHQCTVRYQCTDLKIDRHQCTININAYTNSQTDTRGQINAHIDINAYTNRHTDRRRQTSIHR